MVAFFYIVILTVGYIYMYLGKFRIGFLVKMKCVKYELILDKNNLSLGLELFAI